MIEREQFQEWKHHPVSKVFLQFLKDKQEFLKTVAIEQWVGGSKSFAENSDTVRGQIIELSEIAELPFEAIEAFYKERENAAEGTVDQES